MQKPRIPESRCGANAIVRPGDYSVGGASGLPLSGGVG